jgi:hypothetical protein
LAAVEGSVINNSINTRDVLFICDNEVYRIVCPEFIQVVFNIKLALAWTSGDLIEYAFIHTSPNLKIAPEGAKSDVRQATGRWARWCRKRPVVIREDGAR